MFYTAPRACDVVEVEPEAVSGDASGLIADRSGDKRDEDIIDATGGDEILADATDEHVVEETRSLVRAIAASSPSLSESLAIGALLHVGAVEESVA